MNLRILVLLAFLFSFSFSLTKDEIIELYKEGNYLELCNKTQWNFLPFRNDETILSIITLSCINSDKLNAAVRVSRLMTKTIPGRANSAYAANLYLIKRLIIQFVYDGVELSGISLPKSNHFLSKIFEKLVAKDYTRRGDKIIINTDEANYILEPLQNEHHDGVKITIIKDNHSSEHLFW